MKAIIVEDEKRKDSRLSDELHRLNRLTMIKVFFDKEKAFKEIISIQPEMVFINSTIEMYNKWNFIEKVRKHIPKTLIVIVDDNQKFVLNPLKLHSLDYVLDTVDGFRFNHTLYKGLHVMHEKREMVHAFRMLHFTDESSSKMLHHTAWRTQKGKEIFAYLLHNRRKMVSKNTILQKFWPKSDSKKAMSQLYTTIFHIRKTIESMNLPIEIFNMEHFYMLDLKGVSFDVDIFKEHFESRGPLNSETLPTYLKMIDMYTGDYFELEGFAWAKTERYRLRMYWMHYIREVASFYMKQENYTGSIALYMQMQNRYPEYEESYEQLIKLFYEFGDRASAIEQYHSLAKMLRKSFNTTPHKKIKEWVDVHVH